MLTGRHFCAIYLTQTYRQIAYHKGGNNVVRNQNHTVRIPSHVQRGYRRAGNAALGRRSKENGPG